MLISSILCLSLLIAPAAVAETTPAHPFAQTDDCADWQDCRDRALAAKDAGEFERFHDLAWRAVQKGPRNDANLMTMLARAQSLSGRPGDALVMLQRLASLGVAVPDAAESEDFRRVRALPGWAELQTRIAEAAAAPGGAAAKKTTVPERTPAGGAESKAATPASPVPKTETPKAEPSKPAEPAAKPAEGDAPGAEVEDAVRFTTIPFEPAGLAYDAVSNRFIIGDRRDRKLNVIGERSQRIATLAGEESAGFGEVEAIAIDPREGDLWVASTPDGESPPKLHKLQLISGRQLFTATLPAGAGDARVTDIAVDVGGVVFALDPPGRRLFALRPGSQELELVPTKELPAGVSIAPSANGAIYVAGPEGLHWLDSSGGNPAELKPSDDADVANLACIRWHRGSLVAVQRSADGAFQIIRIRLGNGGRRVTRVDVLEKNVPLASPSAIAVSGDQLFYLARKSGYSATGGMDVTIRRVRLR